MIKNAEVEDGDAVICVVHKQFHFMALDLAHRLAIAIWNFFRYGLAA